MDFFIGFFLFSFLVFVGVLFAAELEEKRRPFNKQTSHGKSSEDDNHSIRVPFSMMPSVPAGH